MRQLTVIIRSVADDERYSIEELAGLGGVSRRTVRYYVQEGLLPAPLGVGRGRHYDVSHLDQLRRVRSMQEAGLSLQDIRLGLSGVEGAPAAALGPARRPAWPQTTWRRLTLAPGIELHVSADTKLPARDRLDELAAWCRAHLPRQTDEEPL